ncbi:MAG: cupin-like domain-containing protein [Gammaproteobacteria bacterium]|nr:cupin-like domain-containing protein [Gammaproteobacteria bacterium]
MQQIDEWQSINRAVFENEIFPANRPAVLRGLLRNWPSVQAGRQSLKHIVDYINRLDAGGEVNVVISPPETGGRFFYTDDYQSFNFESKDMTIRTALGILASLAEDPRPPAIALQAMNIPDIMPSFLEDNTMPLLDSDVAPRMWMSNRSMIATHFDNNHNIAGVVSGRRRFTVFPPEQLTNLYLGPLLRTPGGTPISAVDLREPDFKKFPRFRQALESAQEAVLEPGDAIYIPILWWHGVESLDPLNILVNYWWNDTLPAHHKPILALIHSVALMSGLPAEQREVWRAFFDYFAFQAEGDPAAHLPSDLRDVLGDLSSADRDQILLFVAERLKSLIGSGAG